MEWRPFGVERLERLLLLMTWGMTTERRNGVKPRNVDVKESRYMKKS